MNNLTKGLLVLGGLAVVAGGSYVMVKNNNVTELTKKLEETHKLRGVFYSQVHGTSFTQEAYDADKVKKALKEYSAFQLIRLKKYIKSIDQFYKTGDESNLENLEEAMELLQFEKGVDNGPIAAIFSGT